MNNARTPTHIDAHVGTRIRIRRGELNMSQGHLGEQLGVTFQQIQKYERGTNRVGASRLYEIAQVLKVPLTYFYGGLSATQSVTPQRAEEIFDFALSKDGFELFDTFLRLRDQDTRRKMINVIGAVATAQHANAA